MLKLIEKARQICEDSWGIQVYTEHIGLRGIVGIAYNTVAFHMPQKSKLEFVTQNFLSLSWDQVCRIKILEALIAPLEHMVWHQNSRTIMTYLSCLIHLRHVSDLQHVDTLSVSVQYSLWSRNYSNFTMFFLTNKTNIAHPPTYNAKLSSY